MEQPTDQIEQFITMLRTTGTQVDEGLQHVESDATALDHLAEEVHEQLAALSHEVEGLLNELAHDEQAAASELDQLGDAAHGVADARFAAALDHLEHAESTVHQGLEGVRNQLDHDASGLHDQGFQPFTATLHSVDSALDASRAEADHAFQALDTALQSLTHDLQAAATEVDHSLVAAAAILGDEDVHQLEHDATECVNGLQHLAPEVEGASNHLGETAHQLYAVWSSEADTEAHQLEEALGTLYQGAAEAVTTAGTEKVVDPAEKVAGEAVPGLVEELGEQVSTLEAGQQVAAELPPLAADLEVTSGVIGTIDELVKSMSE